MIIRTQRDLRKALAEEKSMIKEEEFFLSNAYHEFLMSVIKGVTENYKSPVEVHIIITSPDKTAWTDGKKIFLNLNCELFAGMDIKKKHEAIIGIVLHELGHVLFTDFRISTKSFNELLDNKKFFPKPETKELKNVEEWLYENNANNIFSFFKYLDNAIEDGFVNKRIVSHIPGYGENLVFFLNDIREKNSSYEEQKESLDKITLILNQCLSISNYGEFDYDKDKSKDDEIVKLIYQIKADIDKATHERNSYERQKIKNLVFIKIFQVIMDEYEKLKEKAREEKKVERSASSKSSGSTKKSSESEDASASDEDFDDDIDIQSLDDIVGEIISSLEEPVKSSISDEHINTASVKPVDDYMEDETETSYDDSSDKSEEIDSIMDKFAEEKVGEKQEDGIKKQMTEDLKGIPLSEIHKGRQSLAIRQVITDRGLARSYETQEMDVIAKRLARNMKKEIKERVMGDTLDGLYMGKRLEARSLHREDKKFFSNKVLPTDEPDMEVSILIDLSGSMRGDNIDQARKAAYILYNYCKELKIPISVYGHDEEFKGRRAVRITQFASPDSLDNKDHLRILSMEYGENNRDGYALSYCIERLAKSKASKKLFFIISDGAPAAEMYGGEIANKDIQDVVMGGIKKGISVITCGIGYCADEVRSVYMDGVPEKYSAKFLDITELEKLPKLFPALVRKYILG